MKEVSPVAICKWIGLAYAGAVILFLLSGADALEVVFLSFLFLPWIVGPAVLAAIGAKFSRSGPAAWAFLALGALIVGSTAWFWVHLFVISPDAQNGIAMIFFPLLQYAAVLLFFAGAFVFGWRAKRDAPPHRQGA